MTKSEDGTCRQDQGMNTYRFEEGAARDGLFKTSGAAFQPRQLICRKPKTEGPFMLFPGALPIPSRLSLCSLRLSDTEVAGAYSRRIHHNVA